MSERDDQRDDEERLLVMLGEALQPEVKEPPAERVTALRRALEREPAPADDPAISEPTPLASRRRWVNPFVAAAIGIAAGVAVGLVVGASVWRESTPTVPMEQVALQGVPAGIEADAELIAHTWGTEIILTVEGLEDGTTYDVMFQRPDGTEVDAGTFLGVAGRPVVCRLNAATLREDVAGFRVVDVTTGEELLRSELA